MQSENADLDAGADPRPDELYCRPNLTTHNVSPWPANMIYPYNVVLMLGQRRIRWASVKTTLDIYVSYFPSNHDVICMVE